MSRRVLIVEDDPDVRRSLERFIGREGCVVSAARDGQDALDLLEEGPLPNLILTDLKMPRAGGREVLKAGIQRRVPVVILTAFADVQLAVELMREGAANFLSKPFTHASLKSVLEDAFGRSSHGDEQAPGEPAVVGEDALFRAVLESVPAIAETDATVLITGESGTGKEVIAQLVHRRSRRAHGPFVAINCGAIPEALFESELFGHARGAFTGATQSRLGRFQLAEGGTLFLDEVGDLPLAVQVKLLRAIQERRIEAVGDSTPRPVDVRLVAATHRDLRGMVDDGQFRQDLFYRLNVIQLALPSLRERTGDIAALIRHFLNAANQRHGRSVTGIAGDALAAMQAYPWPGNLRELSNAVERMVVLRKSGELVLTDVPPEVRTRPQPRPSPSLRPELPEGGLDLKQALADFEDALIEQALARTGGNRNAAAQLLGMNRTTLVEKLKRRR